MCEGNCNCKKEKKTYCWFCRGEHELIWNGDFDFSDYGIDGDGVVATLTCPNCNATAEFYSPMEDK